MTANASPAEIVVVGGGIAALEVVLALRAFAGDRVHVTLVADAPDFVLRPTLSAVTPGRRGAERHPLDAIATDLGASLVHAAVASIDTDGRRVVLRRGEPLPYDSLVIANGARSIPAFEDAIALGGTVEGQELRTLREQIANGEVRSVAFIAPTLAGWLVPLYEAALTAANRGFSMQIALITREARPLELFGTEASGTVAAALEDAGVVFFGGRSAVLSEGTVTLRDHDPLSVDRVVALPLVRGHRISGLPATGRNGLIAVNEYGRVAGLTDVYAAGDATDEPVKHGSIATQQADAVAAAITARLDGAEPAPRVAVALRATLLTGSGVPIALGDGAGDDEHLQVPGQYLAPYLRGAAEPLAA